ncbi:Peroxidase [Thalictrum thalictroides]|uniref:Peroxidase n=1 Tax=Thalictrum thalictroides TaxID=46969 RepID=A0A7J6V7F7_THATH|nr:Peroxidase [Thalictrum thalictroides]
MDSFSSPSSGSPQISPEAAMDQLKHQLAQHYAQELMETMQGKCFEKCISKPGTSLSGGESSCISSAHLQEARLEVGFYELTCGVAEFIVKDEVRKGFFWDRGIAAGLGCDGSVLIDSSPTNTAEKDSPANNPSLRGFEIIDNAKARIESICEGVVSCADILAFAARDSVQITGGLGYDVPAGRRDGRISSASETSNLPPPTFNVDQLTQSFKSKGLTQDEMVTLSGAHTIGRSHCTSFSNRLYSFNFTSKEDSSLDPIYLNQLQQQCPEGSNDPSLVVPMNPASPITMDISYYGDILANRGLFTSDQTLISNLATAQQVAENSRNPFLWNSKFAAAMVKMGQIGVLTGTAGEIRLNCRVPN